MTCIRAGLVVLAVYLTAIGIYRNEVAEVFKKAVNL